MIFHASLLASSLAGAAIALNRSKARRAEPPSPLNERNPGLPALSQAEIRAILHDAEQAAIRNALGDNRPVVNPHTQGTRAHILWETHFSSVLMEWAEPDPA
jgi:hypothetical protein